MNGPDALKQEDVAPRERISTFDAAILHIDASLDPDPVPRKSRSRRRMRQAWSGRRDGYTDLARTCMGRPRRKVGNAAGPASIASERGPGYRMARPRDR